MDRARSVLDSSSSRCNLKNKLLTTLLQTTAMRYLPHGCPSWLSFVIRPVVYLYPAPGVSGMMKHVEKTTRLMACLSRNSVRRKLRGTSRKLLPRERVLVDSDMSE